MHLEKFVHTNTGKILMSILLGLGLATLFRTVCKGNNCLRFIAPPIDEINNKVYKYEDKCVTYIQEPTHCSSKYKIVPFE